MYRKALVPLLAGLMVAACVATSGTVPSPSVTAQPTGTLLPAITATPIPTTEPSYGPEPTPITTQFPDFPDGPEPSVSPETPDPTATPKPTPKPTATPAPAAETYTLNLYTKGAFVRQQTNYWCVPASTQIMLNMIKRRADHSYDTQLAIWKVAWANIKYTGFKPQVYGSDPQGWVAALETFGGGDYEWVNGKSFASALKNAVKAMALTGRPVGVVVMSGSHAWVLNGFVATADPTTTNDFKVLAVYVTAPGYGLFSYDPKPNTKLTTAQFKKRLLAYHSKLTDEVWEGYYVTILPRR